MAYRFTDDYRSYGGDPRIGAAPLPVDVGQDTRTLVLDVDTVPLGAVTCEFAFVEGFEALATRTWTADEWASDAAKTLTIPQSIDSIHVLTCESGGSGQPRWISQWWVDVRADEVGPEAVFSDDEEYLSFSRGTAQHGYAGPRRAVSNGDLVRVVGPAGTWPAYGYRLVTLHRSADDRDPVIDIRSAVVSDDGSALEFRMPAEPTAADSGSDAYFTVDVFSSSEDGPARSAAASFRAPLVFGAAAAVEVSTSVSARYALSFQRLTATARISGSTGTLTGTVSFAANGRTVGTTPVSGTEARVRLPALTKGTYSITATFTPADGSPPVTSPGAWLRVLR